VLGDLFAPSERGRAIAIYSLAPLLGPVVGPVAGAWIAQKSTWRWVFWSTTIVDAVIQLVGLWALQETFAPVLLERRAAALRKELASGADADAEKGARRYRDVRTPFDGGARSWRAIFAKSLVRPFALFVREPIIQLLGVYMAFIYGTLYRALSPLLSPPLANATSAVFLTTLPATFGPTGVYHERTGIAGLNYIAFGVGLTGASQINARLLDRIYNYYTRKNGGAGRPEYRLPSMVPGTILLPIGLLLTGWSVQYKLHWIVPDIVRVPATRPLRRTDADARTGHRDRRRGDDPQLPEHPDVRHRRVHAARRVRARGRLLPALARRVRLPALRARHVRRAGLRERGYDPRRGRGRDRVPGAVPAVEVWGADQEGEPVCGRVGGAGSGGLRAW
jgi:hypothetical protein